GDVNLVGGWDGLTPTLDFLDKVPQRLMDIDAILADDGAWGNNDGTLTIGGGAQTVHVAAGSAHGTTTALGHSVEVVGSNAGQYAQIGFAPVSGVSPDGDITVMAKDGGMSLKGGSVFNAYA